MTGGLVRAGEVYGDTPAAERDTAGFPGGASSQKIRRARPSRRGKTRPISLEVRSSVTTRDPRYVIIRDKNLTIAAFAGK